MRTSTIIMMACAVLFGLLAVFGAQTWLNYQAEARLKSMQAPKQPTIATKTVVVASASLRYGRELAAGSLKEVAWPEGAIPNGTFAVDRRTAHRRKAHRPVVDRAERTDPRLEGHRPGPESHPVRLDPGRHEGGDDPGQRRRRRRRLRAAGRSRRHPGYPPAAGKEQRQHRRRAAEHPRPGHRPAGRRRQRQADGRKGGHPRGRYDRGPAPVARRLGRRALACAAQGGRAGDGGHAPHHAARPGQSVRHRAGASRRGQAARHRDRDARQQAAGLQRPCRRGRPARSSRRRTAGRAHLRRGRFYAWGTS